MLTEIQKNEILQLVEDEKQRLGSYRAVANKCKISEATISQLRKGSYAADGDDMYTTIAIALGYRFGSGAWNISETSNYVLITQLLDLAKDGSDFFCISHKAGSGKTAASNDYLDRNRYRCVYKINCMEWDARVFLLRLAREINADLPKGYANIPVLIEAISDTFKNLSFRRPLLILDQANSLKTSSLRTLIHIYNLCENILGMVILGTDNLEYEIKRGAKLMKSGYDELDSRFGSSFFHLIGATFNDCRKICEANGITNEETQKLIFRDCEPIRKTNDDGKTITVVEDLRRLKRLIKREALKIRYYDATEK